MKNITLAKKVSRFESMYLPGFYIHEPETITSLALIFEKVHFPNYSNTLTQVSQDKVKPELSIVVEGAKYFHGDINLDGKSIKIEKLFKRLNPTQIDNLRSYLTSTYGFHLKFHKLFSEEIFTSNAFGDEAFPFEVDERKELGDGKSSLTLKFKDLSINKDEILDINQDIASGLIPVFDINQSKMGNTGLYKSNAAIATILAMKSINLVLPATKFAEADDILEARHKLSNHLPPFWSAMLKFSVEAKKIITNSSEDEFVELQNYVDTNIRPVLIDLTEKLNKERKNWFYKILGPVSRKIKFAIGKPSITNLDLITSSLSLATNIGVDYLSHQRKMKEIEKEAGLSYLLKLGENIK